METDLTDVISKVEEAFEEDDFPDPQTFRIFGPGETKAAFKKIALISLNSLIRHASLEKHEKVLDIGSGSGRTALALTHYLDSSGRYDGIDPVLEAVRWCQDNISSKHNNFCFEFVNFNNRMYNKNGTVDPETYKFRWDDNSFDLIYLFSVFTHMKPDGVGNYLAEIKRMLSKNGRVLMTMFLVDEHTERQIENNKTHRPFFKENAIYWTDNSEIHESAIAYSYEYVKDLLEMVGLSISEEYARGGWREKKEGQDILVAWNR